MSGRDLRAFLSQHRSGTFHIPSRNVAAELTKRYVCGGSHGRGRPVDYEELLNKSRKHKETASKQLRHVERLTHQSKQRREVELLNLHREVWTTEMHKLLREVCMVEAELEQWKNVDLTEESRQDRMSSETWVEIAECEMELAAGRRQFEDTCLEPVKEATRTLKNWTRAREKEGVEQVDVATRAGLVKVLTQSQEKLKSSWKELENECNLLEGCLGIKGMKCRGLIWNFEETKEGESDDGNDVWGCSDCSGDDGSVEWVESDDSVAGEEPRHSAVGVVPAALLSCSSGELCASLAEELASLDIHYRDRLQQLRDRHHQALSCPHGGWSSEEAVRFRFLLDQYPAAMKGHSRRELYLDRLAREFPQHTRHQLVEHEKWVWSWRAYHKQRCVVLGDWCSHRAELEAKITAAVETYEHERASKEVELHCHEQQLQLCRALHKKVQEWREEKVHQACLEAEQAAVFRAEQEVWLREESEKKRRRYLRTKGRIQSYRQQQEVELEREREEEEQLRLAAEEERQRRAGMGKQRVELRKQLILERLAQQREREKAKVEEEREREKQLDRLRQQVAIVADSDPNRLLQHTQATQARLEPVEATPTSFLPLHSYTAHQVTSDPRVRLEVALREAGLLKNDYARYMLSRAPPPSNPRPDQQSSVLKP